MVPDAIDGAARARGAARSRRQRLDASARQTLVNVALFAVLGTAYLHHAPSLEHPRARAFLVFAWIGSSAQLALLVGLPLLLAAALWPARGRRLVLAGALTALAWTLASAALVADTRVYGIFRYHVNGMVWNVLTTPGADEAVHIGAGDYARFGLLVAAVAVGQVWLYRRLDRAAIEDARSPWRRLTRPALVWGLLLVPALVLEKALYAQADLRREREILALSRLFPLYQRLTVKAYAGAHWGFVAEARPQVVLASGGILLDYPKARPAIDPRGARPNVLIIVIDSLRSDMLDPAWMPHVCALEPRARVFDNHQSSGNATRFGIFGLLYGLHGVYWEPIYNEQRSPVLVDELLDLGYDLRILTSASMSFPEFRSTAWVRVEDRIEDRLSGKRPDGRDDAVAERFEAWMERRGDTAAPFFGFLLLDAPHQPYAFPDEEARVRPYADTVRYLALSKGADEDERQLLFDRYRNAVHYADAVTGRILEALARSGHADDTLLVVTGDHGEEFFENGFFGHTSNFTPQQVHVPFLLAGPGVPPGRETRPTSHIDLPPTLLELLGADPTSRPEWCLGQNLLEPAAERRPISAGWDLMALLAPDAILVVPTQAHRGDVEAYDARWRPHPNERAVLAREGHALLELALECRRFLR